MEIPGYAIGTTAIHNLGDLSREESDLCYLDREIDDYYIGNWVTGYGFFDVKFPKETVRELTEEERIKYQKMRFQVSNQPPFSLPIK